MRHPEPRLWIGCLTRSAVNVACGDAVTRDLADIYAAERRPAESVTDWADRRVPFEAYVRFVQTQLGPVDRWTLLHGRRQMLADLEALTSARMVI